MLPANHVIARPHAGSTVDRRALLGLAVGVVFAASTVPGFAGAQEKLKIAAIFSTPIEEPWVNQIHEALLKSQEELGIEYKWAESVPSADYARVLREFARDGYKMISGDAFAAEDITRRVAKEFPDVAFVIGSGQGPAEPNFCRLRQLDPRAGLPVRHHRRQADQVEHHRHGRGDGHP